LIVSSVAVSNCSDLSESIFSASTSVSDTFNDALTLFKLVSIVFFNPAAMLANVSWCVLSNSFSSKNLCSLPLRNELTIASGNLDSKYTVYDELGFTKTVKLSESFKSSKCF